MRRAPLASTLTIVLMPWFLSCSLVLYRPGRAGENVVGFFTTQFVPARSELTIDYNFEWYSDSTIECKCGAASCIGFIGK